MSVMLGHGEWCSTPCSLLGLLTPCLVLVPVPWCHLQCLYCPPHPFLQNAAFRVGVLVTDSMLWAREYVFGASSSQQSQST